MEMDDDTGEIAGTAVQIGNPIKEKQVQEVVLRARDAGLYSAITDCGAGGFSSAVGEMGAEVGARVELANVPLKYPGLQPWEIWLSEAQERMVLAVPPDKLAGAGSDLRRAGRDGHRSGHVRAERPSDRDLRRRVWWATLAMDFPPRRAAAPPFAGGLAT